jgi:hypothetical protein
MFGKGKANSPVCVEYAIRPIAGAASLTTFAPHGALILASIAWTSMTPTGQIPFQHETRTEE